MFTKKIIYKYFHYALTYSLVIFKYHYLVSLKKGFFRVLVINFAKISQIKLKEFTNQCLYRLYLGLIFSHLFYFFNFVIYKYIPNNILQRLWVFQKRSEKLKLEVIFEYYKKSYFPPSLNKLGKKKSFKLKLFGHIFSNIGNKELPISINFYNKLTFKFFFFSFGFIYFLVINTPGWVDKLPGHKLVENVLPVDLKYGNSPLCPGVNDFSVRKVLGNCNVLPNFRFFNKENVWQSYNWDNLCSYKYGSKLVYLNIFSKIISANFLRTFLYFEGLLLLHERVHFSIKFTRLLHTYKYNVFFFFNKERLWSYSSGILPEVKKYIIESFDRNLHSYFLLEIVRRYFNRRYFLHLQGDKNTALFSMRLLNVYKVLNGSNILYKKGKYFVSGQYPLFGSLLGFQDTLANTFYSGYCIYYPDLTMNRQSLRICFLEPLDNFYWFLFKTSRKYMAKYNWSPITSIFSLLFFNKYVTSNFLTKLSYYFMLLSELIFSYEITSFTTPTVFHGEFFHFKRVLPFSNYLIKDAPYINFFNKGYVSVIFTVLQYAFFLYTYTTSKNSYITKILYSSLLPMVFSRRNQIIINVLNEYISGDIFDNSCNMNMDSSMFYSVVAKLYLIWYDITYAFIYTSGIFNSSSMPTNKLKFSRIFHLEHSSWNFRSIFWGWTYGTWISYFSQPNLVTKASYLGTVDFKAVYSYLLNNIKFIYTNFLCFFDKGGELVIPYSGIVFPMKDFAFVITKYSINTYSGRTEFLNPFFIDYDLSKEYNSVFHYNLISVNDFYESDKNYAFFSPHYFLVDLSVGFFIKRQFLLRYLTSYIGFIYFRGSFNKICDFMDTRKYRQRILNISFDFFETMGTFAYTTQLIIRRIQKDDDILLWSHSLKRETMNASKFAKNLEEVSFIDFSLSMFTNFVDQSLDVFFHRIYFNLHKGFTGISESSGKPKFRFKNISWYFTRSELIKLASTIEPLCSLNRYSFNLLRGLWLNKAKLKNDPRMPVEFLFLDITYRSIKKSLFYSSYQLYPYYYYPKLYLSCGLLLKTNEFKRRVYGPDELYKYEKYNQQYGGPMHKYFFLKFLSKCKLPTLLWWLDMLVYRDIFRGYDKAFKVPIRFSMHMEINFQRFFSSVGRWHLSFKQTSVTRITKFGFPWWVLENVLGPLNPDTYTGLGKALDLFHDFPLKEERPRINDRRLKLYKHQAIVKLLVQHDNRHMHIRTTRPYFYRTYCLNFLYFLKYKVGRFFYINSSLQIYTPFLLVYNIFSHFIRLVLQYLQKVLFLFFC